MFWYYQNEYQENMNVFYSLIWLKEGASHGRSSEFSSFVYNNNNNNNNNYYYYY